MKKIEKYIIAVITLIAIGAISTAIYFGFNILTNLRIDDSKQIVKMQIIEFDITDGSKKIAKELSVTVGDVIELNEFSGNNLEILSITNEKWKFLEKQ